MTAPARYMPFASGKYDVKPGLFRFGTDFGNGISDRQFFQIDDQLESYQSAKQQAVDAHREDVIASQDLQPTVADGVSRFIATQFAEEHPQRPAIEASASLDDIVMRLQEDVTIVCKAGVRHWLAYAHVCLPSHWLPREKVGLTFAEIHEPVPGMAKMNARGSQYIDQMIAAESGLVRFVWGLQADDALSRLPGQVQPITQKNPPRFVRVERQVIRGFPELNASLFLIRPYVYSIDQLRSEPALFAALCTAVANMTEDQRRYKGIPDDCVELFDAGS